MINIIKISIFITLIAFLIFLAPRVENAKIEEIARIIVKEELNGRS